MNVAVANGSWAPAVADHRVSEKELGTVQVAPPWTADAFEDDVWRAVDPNPSLGPHDKVSFELVPAEFRPAVKEFVAARARLSEHGKRRARSAGAAKQALLVLGPVSRFLRARGISKFSEASEDDIESAHLDFCGLSKGRPISRGLARSFCQILGQMHRMGPGGSGLVSDGLSFDASTMAIATGRCAALPAGGSTPVLREDTAKELLTLAIDWIENKADAVLWLLKAADGFVALRPSTQGDWLLRSRVKAARQFEMENPGFYDGVERAREALGAPLNTFLPAAQAGNATMTDASEIELDAARIDLISVPLRNVFQGLCYVVCAAFNGWRGSEILSIRPDYLRETPGGYLLGTKIRKTAANATQVIDRPVPGIVASAIRALSNINAVNSDAVSLSRGMFRRPSGDQARLSEVSSAITAACHRFLGIEDRINSHQFRRFFAYFFLRRFEGNLDAVRRHFRHVSRSMVWAYAQDALNAKHLVEEKKSLATSIAKAVIFDEGHKSISVGDELIKVRGSLRLGAKVLTVEDAAQYIDKQIQLAYSDVHATEWGYCLIQSGDKGAACESKSGPIEDRAEPSTCGRCKFLCTGAGSIPFWKQSALLHQELANHPQSTRLMRSESERFLATATNILKRHGTIGESGGSA